MKMQDRMMQYLKRAGYSATPLEKGFILVQDPVIVLTGGNRRTEYKATRIHTLDALSFIHERM